MLSKAVIFVFTTFGVFAVLMGFMTPEFITGSFNPSYVNPEIKEQFQAADVLMFQNAGQDNMTYSYSSLNDGPDPPDWEFGLPSGQYLEVWWSEGFFGRTLELRHTTSVWYGWTFVKLNFKYANGTWIEEPKDIINRPQIVSAWDSEKGYSSFYGTGVLSASILLYPTNISKTIGEAWDDGQISYVLSYEVNWNATSFSAWNIVGQILSFQIPNLGIPGIFGTMLGLIISFPYYSLIAYIVYKLVTGIIPFLSGGSGD